MIEMLKNWYHRRFTDPQAMALFAILFFGFVAIYFFSNLLAPLLIAIVLAYLLEYPIRLLNEKLNIKFIPCCNFWCNQLLYNDMISPIS